MNEPSSPRAAHWLHHLKPGFLVRQAPAAAPDPLRSTGLVLRDAREAKGLGLRDLALRTRISIAVLEALEGGWKDRLPEATYLRAMLPLLEQHLDLPAGSLDPILPHAGRRLQGGRSGEPLAPLSPSAFHLLTSWQSALLYGLLVAGLLYGVNLQQQRLAAMGRLVVNPIPLTPTPEQAEPTEPFPELRPLQLAARGQAKDLLAKATQKNTPDLTLGMLQLSLSQPTQVDLRSQRSGVTLLKALEGELSLPVMPPFELRLTPAPPAGAVQWKGQAMREKPPPSRSPRGPSNNQTAVYAVPGRPAPTGTDAKPSGP